MKKLLLLTVFGCAAGCRDTQLPPPIGAGTLTGRVLVAQPGESSARPAVGAEVRLIESGLSVTAGEDGRFELNPILTTTGTLRLSLGGLNQVRTLESLKAGPGKVTVLGDVALSQNASVQGEVILEDDPNNEGTLAFVEGEASSAYTNRSGQFLLRDLPTGNVSLALYRQGYAPSVLQLELRSGERFFVDRVVLKRQAISTAQISGKATLAEQTDSTGILVKADLSNTASASAGGSYALMGVAPGVRSFAFSRDGYITVNLVNRLIALPIVVLPPVVLVQGLAAAAVPTPVFPPYDGGAAEDAGVADAGVADAGVDAGVDPSPVALIDPLPSRLLQDAGQLVLNGSNSSGMPALALYSWTVDAGSARLRDGGVVRPSVNNSVIAGVTTIELPLPPAVVAISLQVTDLIGRVSNPTTTGFIVGDRPLAIFDAGSLPSSLYGGETAVIDATPSRDTLGSGIASRRWVTSPNPNVTTTSLVNDQQLRITVGTISFGQQLNVSHYVTNGLGFESLERLHTITLLAGTLPSSPWSVSTSGALTVDGGTVVPLVARLDAGSMLQGYANPANFDWAWVALTDAGLPPQWAITDPSLPSTTFIPPVVEGAPVRYDFRVTATPRPPLAPGATSANLVVLAEDKVKPQLQSYSSSGSVGSAMGTLLVFSEEMNNAFSGVDIVRAASSSVTATRLYRPKQLMLVTRPPPSVAELWEFRLTPSIVSDVMGNTLVPLDANPQFRASFVPEVRWTPLFQLPTAQLTVEPMPALVLSAGATLGQHAGVVVARVGTSAVAGRSGPFAQCLTPPCTITAQNFSSGLASSPGDTNPLFLHQGTPYFQPVPGVVMGLDGGTFPAGPGLVFSNGAALSATSFSGTTLKLVGLDAGAWDLTNSTPAFAYFNFGATSVVAGAAMYEAGPSKATCLAVLTGTGVVPLTRLGAGSFGIPLSNNPAATSLTVTQVRVGVTSSLSCYFAFLQTDAKVVFTDRSAGDFGSTGNLVTLVSSGVSFIDVLADTSYSASSPFFWLATIESGQLYLYWTIGTPSNPLTTRVAGPTGPSLNANPACVASKPTLSQLEQAVYVTWQEQCSGQPYTVYTRGLF